MIFSRTAPPLGTIIVSQEEISAQSGIGNNTANRMISEALRDAKTSQAGRFQSTTLFMREMLTQSATHSSRRLRIAVICLLILLAQITTALVYVNFTRRHTQDTKIATVADKVAQLENQQHTVERLRTELTTALNSIGLPPRNPNTATEWGVDADGESGLEDWGVSAEAAEASPGVSSAEDGPTPAKRSSPAVLPIPIQSSFLFSVSSNEVLPQGRNKLRQLAQVLKNIAPSKKILVEGHASRERAGQESQNQLISEKRARSVAAELALYGVPERNLTFKGLGDTRPVQSNTTEKGRTKNRRVEVKVILGET